MRRHCIFKFCAFTNAASVFDSIDTLRVSLAQTAKAFL